ncbi:MAG: FecR domain-containing protein [Byssovorax sp.]
MNPEEPPGRWLDPGLDSARIARQWAGIAGRLDAGARPRWWLGAALAGAVMAIAALGIGLSRWSAPHHEVAVAPANSSVYTFADGSEVALFDDAELTTGVLEGTRISSTLKSGKARFTVVPDPARVFTVLAGEVEVRVAGAQFQVDFDPTSGAVTVAVTGGEAEIRSAAQPGEVHRVGVGESWSTARAAVVPVAPPASATAAASADPVAPAPSAALPVHASTAPAEDPKSLFESANQARRADDLARASTLYRELTRRFPNDPRARVAALELGRIEMDRGQGADRDPAVAEQALRQASSAEAGGSVHEDALARLVQLYAAKGDTRACQVAQARYLAAYPNGVHGAQVRAACAPRGASSLPR